MTGTQNHANTIRDVRKIQIASDIFQLLQTFKKDGKSIFHYLEKNQQRIILVKVPYGADDHLYVLSPSGIEKHTEPKGSGPWFPKKVTQAKTVSIEEVIDVLITSSHVDLEEVLSFVEKKVDAQLRSHI